MIHIHDAKRLDRKFQTPKIYIPLPGYKTSLPCTLCILSQYIKKRKVFKDPPEYKPKQKICKHNNQYQWTRVFLMHKNFTNHPQDLPLITN